MIEPIRYTDIVGRKTLSLKAFKYHVEKFGGLMLYVDDALLRSALHELQGLTKPIVRHNPKTLYENKVFEKFSISKGGYVLVNNQAYSHMLRFMYLGEYIDIEGLDNNDEGSTVICDKLAESMDVYKKLTADIIRVLEGCYDLPTNLLATKFEASHYFLEFNYYFPVKEETEIAGAETIKNKFMRMKPHIDMWATTLTIPTNIGENALQFMNTSGEYYSLFFPENCFFFHLGNAIKQWGEPYDLPVHIPKHRVVTDAAGQERFSCLIKFTDEPKIKE
jgi:hypothetical protein